MLLFVAFVQGFIGTLVWLLLSEIFPMAIRGFAMGIAVFVLWRVNALISFVFPILVEAAGRDRDLRPVRHHQPGVDLLRRKFVPETRGRTLEELEDDFRTHDAAHLVHTRPGERARLLTSRGPHGLGKRQLVRTPCGPWRAHQAGGAQPVRARLPRYTECFRTMK